MMEIEKLIFNIVNYSAHTWVRYWKQKEMQGLTMPGEYIEIRGHYLADKLLDEIFEAGFKIKTISPQKLNADVYCDVLLVRELK